MYNPVMWPFNRKKSPEIEENETEYDFIGTFDKFQAQLSEILIIVQRIDQRHYKAKAKSNGDNREQEDIPGDDFSWMRGR